MLISPLALVVFGLTSATPESFQPSADIRLDDLELVVSEAAPDLENARLRVDLATAGVRQSRLLPNPSVDMGIGTLPLGTTNPPDLERPLAHVPNYGVGISFPVQIAKRGPRIREARALERGAKAELEAVTRSQALELATTLGELATATLRREGFEQVVVDAERSVAAAELRTELTYGASLDVDRLRIEVSRAEQAVLVARSDIAAALARCAVQLARPCEEFATGKDARAYLEGWIDAPAGADDLGERPDLRALSEYAEAAKAARSLARAQRIPDPTVRLGYLHDTFVISGNQMNSMSISLAFALPVFDRGQARRQAAEARMRRLTREHDKRLAAAQMRVPALTLQLDIDRERQVQLTDEALPAARTLVDDLERAVEQRLTSIADVVQARRTVRELVLDEADAYAAAYTARLELLRTLMAMEAER